MMEAGLNRPERSDANLFFLRETSAERRPRVAVVGGGPAGLIAAETLADAGAAVTVYDGMPSVGRKLLLAGRGGLNLTHSEPIDGFVARYGVSAARLRQALDAFPPDAARAWAAGLGEPTVVGSSGRVFPRSWKASPLLRAWLRRLDGQGVRFALRHRWTGFGPDGGLVFDAPEGRLSVERPAATVLALGGASWPRLGSDGGWTAILERDGIPIAPLRPSNVALRVAWSERFRSRCEGQPLKRIAATIGGVMRFGEAVVTASGLEGGVVYGLSGPVRDALDRDGEAWLAIDLRPDLTTEALAEALARPRLRQSASTFLRKAAGLAPAAIGLLHEAAGRDLPSDATELARLVKAVPVRVAGTGGLDRAISSAGGVRFDALDERLMLRARPGVFVAGEMLDWDAPTGGYLLQASFATGVAAAEGALGWIDALDETGRSA